MRSINLKVSLQLLIIVMVIILIFWGMSAAQRRQSLYYQQSVYHANEAAVHLEEQRRILASIENQVKNLEAQGSKSSEDVGAMRDQAEKEGLEAAKHLELKAYFESMAKKSWFSLK